MLWRCCWRYPTWTYIIISLHSRRINFLLCCKARMGLLRALARVSLLQPAPKTDRTHNDFGRMTVYQYYCDGCDVLIRLEQKDWMSIWLPSCFSGLLNWLLRHRQIICKEPRRCIPPETPLHNCKCLFGRAVRWHSMVHPLSAWGSFSNCGVMKKVLRNRGSGKYLMMTKAWRMALNRNGCIIQHPIFFAIGRTYQCGQSATADSWEDWAVHFSTIYTA